MDSMVRIIDVGLLFEKDTTCKVECIRYIDSDYAGDLDKYWSITGMYSHWPKQQ